MSSRHNARQKALQILYQQELTRQQGEEALEKFSKDFNVTSKNLEYAEMIVQGVQLHRNEIDASIEKEAQNWKLDRMAPIDKNLLRIGVFELLYSEDVPATVAINEAVEIAKKFGGQKTSAFVNGILDAIEKSIQEALVE